ncbi:MAG: hypothetical protein CEN89_197 [Candidatus Berkelbacteria bacterium Licking1014_7]|uniref:Uncharacterized protein n=1 Tax=Candidatus Berkelbacteria bacterium Licking1014_7 TaxID=2017147 RepID=A0A554LK17_9BACT|nr:MAG: hypothetical protein CEN89_197 [Candidatus Berkelbacteria bacterium Licking1014_7]
MRTKGRTKEKNYLKFSEAIYTEFFGQFSVLIIVCIIVLPLLCSSSKGIDNYDTRQEFTRKYETYQTAVDNNAFWQGYVGIQIPKNSPKDTIIAFERGRQTKALLDEKDPKKQLAALQFVLANVNPDYLQSPEFEKVALGKTNAQDMIKKVQKLKPPTYLKHSHWKSLPLTIWALGGLILGLYLRVGCGLREFWNGLSVISSTIVMIFSLPGILIVALYDGIVYILFRTFRLVSALIKRSFDATKSFDLGFLYYRITRRLKSRKWRRQLGNDDLTKQFGKLQRQITSQIVRLEHELRLSQTEDAKQVIHTRIAEAKQLLKELSTLGNTDTTALVDTELARIETEATQDAIDAAEVLRIRQQLSNGLHQ